MLVDVITDTEEVRAAAIVITLAASTNAHMELQREAAVAARQLAVAHPGVAEPVELQRQARAEGPLELWHGADGSSSHAVAEPRHLGKVVIETPTRHGPVDAGLRV